VVAVGAEGHATDPAGVEGKKFLAGLRIPHLPLPVASAGQALSVRAESDAPDYAAVSFEGEKFLASYAFGEAAV
jgi:hypothetical protein